MRWTRTSTVRTEIFHWLSERFISMGGPTVWNSLTDEPRDLGSINEWNVQTVTENISVQTCQWALAYWCSQCVRTVCLCSKTDSACQSDVSGDSCFVVGHRSKIQYDILLSMTIQTLHNIIILLHYTSIFHHLSVAFNLLYSVTRDM